jgi:hypothetical protein
VPATRNCWQFAEVLRETPFLSGRRDSPAATTFGKTLGLVAPLGHCRARECAQLLCGRLRRIFGFGRKRPHWNFGSNRSARSEQRKPPDVLNGRLQVRIHRVFRQIDRMIRAVASRKKPVQFIRLTGWRISIALIEEFGGHRAVAYAHSKRAITMRSGSGTCLMDLGANAHNAFPEYVDRRVLATGGFTVWLASRKNWKDAKSPELYRAI